MAEKLITNLTAKTTPVDADETVLVDSAASLANKKVTFVNIYNYLKSKFDSVYLNISTASSTYVPLSTYDANTILAATTDNTPVALTVGTNSVVGRVAGNITTLAVDNDLTSVSASDDTVPSAKATKTALDLKANTASPTFTGTVVMPTMNETKGSDIASATTTDIGAATGNYVNVTGTTTITGLGTVQAGTRRIVTFTGALTLTHNATSLILPSASNIGTAAGDCAFFVSLGSGNWKCVAYTKADGTPVVSPSSGSYSKGTSQINTSGTITHGLGTTPTRIKIWAQFIVTNSWSGDQLVNGTSMTLVSGGTATGTDLASTYLVVPSGLSSLVGVTGNTTGRVLTNPQFPTTTYCTISSITSTQFTLTWTFGAPGGTTDSIGATKIVIFWECFA